MFSFGETLVVRSRLVGDLLLCHSMKSFIWINLMPETHGKPGFEPVEGGSCDPWNGVRMFMQGLLL